MDTQSQIFSLKKCLRILRHIETVRRFKNAAAKYRNESVSPERRDFHRSVEAKWERIEKRLQSYYESCLLKAVSSNAVDKVFTDLLQKTAA